jgi:hypothetical protein
VPSSFEASKTTRIAGTALSTIDEANRIYRGRMHNICGDNCHSHVACALNRMEARAYRVERWDMVKLAALVFFRGRFLSWWAALYQFGPFSVFAIVIVAATKVK